VAVVERWPLQEGMGVKTNKKSVHLQDII